MSEEQMRNVALVLTTMWGKVIIHTLMKFKKKKNLLISYEGFFTCDPQSQIRFITFLFVEAQTCLHFTVLVFHKTGSQHQQKKPQSALPE